MRFAVATLLTVARILGWSIGRHHYDILAEAIMAVDSPEARVWGDRR